MNMKLAMVSVLVAIGLVGCITRGELRATLWLNNGLAPDMCGKSKAESKYPELWGYGFYRKLSAGGYEFMPFCNPTSRDWSAMYKTDLTAIINQLPVKK